MFLSRRTRQPKKLEGNFFGNLPPLANLEQKLRQCHIPTRWFFWQNLAEIRNLKKKSNAIRLSLTRRVNVNR